MLRRIAEFLDRPAMFRPFHVEGNMHDFLAGMKNVIRALNIGRLGTRDGDDLGSIKPLRQFSNQMERKTPACRDQFETLRTRLEVAIRDGELEIHNEGSHYCFNNPDLPYEVDAMRRTAASILNHLLVQAGIDQSAVHWTTRHKEVDWQRINKFTNLHDHYPCHAPSPARLANHASPATVAFCKSSQYGPGDAIQDPPSADRSEQLRKWASVSGKD